MPLSEIKFLWVLMYFFFSFPITKSTMLPNISYMFKASNFVSGRIPRAYLEHLTWFSDLETERGHVDCLSL